MGKPFYKRSREIARLFLNKTTKVTTVFLSSTLSRRPIGAVTARKVSNFTLIAALSISASLFANYLTLPKFILILPIYNFPFSCGF